MPFYALYNTRCPRRKGQQHIVPVILSKKLYMCMCHIPNGFRDTAISLYSSKFVDKKEILRKGKLIPVQAVEVLTVAGG
jgi:hypothetical protein